jgi:hypothetical protein
VSNPPFEILFLCERRSGLGHLFADAMKAEPARKPDGNGGRSNSETRLRTIGRKRREVLFDGV